MSCKRASNFLTNEKHFAKTISQWELDYGLFTNLPKIAKFTDFSPSSYKLKRGWQNTFPNSETTYHIKLKFFLWTELLKNLLLAKYLISVTAPLIQHQPGYLYQGAVPKFQLFLKKNIENCDFSENHRINSFASNAPFFYPLKTSENLKAF